MSLKIYINYKRFLGFVLVHLIVLCIIFWALYILCIQFLDDEENTVLQQRLLTVQSDRPESHLMNISDFLRQYDKNTVIQWIRDIEASIVFDHKTQSHLSLNARYHSGTSPHFYNGPFSMQHTCKHLKFAYLCPAHITPEKGAINDWTLRINETQLDDDTKQFLHTLQTRYDFYTNVHSHMMRNIQSLHSPFMRDKLNILFFGNSHLRQIFEGLQCTLDEIERNIMHHERNELVDIYIPKIKPIDSDKEIMFDYDDNFCFGINHGRQSKEWNRRQWNGLHLNQTVLDTLFTSQLDAKNIKACKSDKVFLQLKDGTTLHYKFVHNEAAKSIADNGIFDFLQQNWDNNSDFYRHELASEFDIIVFNIGNGPTYDYQKLLKRDLLRLKHTDKPIIMLSTFHGNTEERNVRKYLYDMHPNLNYVNLHQRIYHKLSKSEAFKYLLAGQSVESPKHFCQPGIVEHLSLALLELINLSVLLVK